MPVMSALQCHHEGKKFTVMHIRRFTMIVRVSFYMVMVNTLSVTVKARCRWSAQGKWRHVDPEMGEVKADWREL